MEDNKIILIDSSDDECSPCKIQKVEVIDKSSVNNQEDRNDVIILECDSIQTMLDNKPNVRKEINNKRMELITLNQNINTTNSVNLLNPGGQENKCEVEVPDTTGKVYSENEEKQLANVISPEFKEFLQACTVSNCDKKYKDMIVKKIPNMNEKYIEADEHYVTSLEFKKYLITKTKNIQKKPKNAIIVFNEVYRDLQYRKKQKILLSDREKCHLMKLYKTMRIIFKKIQIFENETVDFDEDNNSSYIKLERYKDRLCTIQKKICSITRENYYSGRNLFKYIDICSKYSEINDCVNLLYRKKKQFPSFSEINNCIRKCVKDKNLNLSEDALTKEIESVFKTVGNTLQHRRKLELYESLSYFLEVYEDDPAEKDPELKYLLEKRNTENQKRIDDVMQRYSDLQEKGDEPIISSDSDDSLHLSNSDSES